MDESDCRLLDCCQSPELISADTLLLLQRLPEQYRLSAIEVCVCLLKIVPGSQRKRILLRLKSFCMNLKVFSSGMFLQQLSVSLVQLIPYKVPPKENIFLDTHDLRVHI